MFVFLFCVGSLITSLCKEIKVFCSHCTLTQQTYYHRIDLQTSMPLQHVISKDQTKAKHNQRWIIIHHYTDSQFREVITVSFALLESSPMVEINYRINTISYCGNTSKSDWVCGPCKQTNSYYKQRVVLKCTSCKQAPYVFRRRNTEWIQWGKDCHLYDAIQSCYIKRSSTMWTLTCKINRSQCQRFRSEWRNVSQNKYQEDYRFDCHLFQNPN